MPNVAGLGGWSGRESDPTIAWFASEVSSGHVRWVYSQGLANFNVKADGRTGDTAVLEAATRTCVRVDTTNGVRILVGSITLSSSTRRRCSTAQAGERHSQRSPAELALTALSASFASGGSGTTRIGRVEWCTSGVVTLPSSIDWSATARGRRPR